MKYTIFGESHGSAIGVVLEGVPPGLALDMTAMAGLHYLLSPWMIQMQTTLSLGE